MLKFYYNPAYKYSNRKIIDLTGDTSFVEHEYENIDSPDTINGHIIYTLAEGENIPTYILDEASNWRWFVSGITQLRTGKYQISLLRDIISENPDIWKNERAYITAGTATNYNKYKRWDLPFTNTKIKQERLNINGDSSFFVFYVNEQEVDNSNIMAEKDLIIKYNNVPGIAVYDYYLDGISELPNYSLMNAGPLYNWGKQVSTIKMYLNTGIFGILGTYDTVVTKEPGQNTTSNITFNMHSSAGYLNSNIKYSDFKNNVNNCRTQYVTAVSNTLDSFTTSDPSITTAQISALAPYVGKTIYDTVTDKAYRLTVETDNIIADQDMDVPTLYSALRNITWPDSTNISGKSGYWLHYYAEGTTYSYVLTEIPTTTSFNFNFKANTRKLPKSAVRCVNIVPNSTHSVSEIAQCLMLSQTNENNIYNTTGRILDIQYLPFSVATSANSNFTIGTDNLTARFLYDDDYQYYINLTDLTDIHKETDTIKIVSPSRASQLLFRPYDNDGNMEFGAKITLKPYTSTIYIRPSTKGLLMFDWDDKDCLIIQEDFSLTNVTSEWTQYVYQNKNYSSIFEREMQGRELERTWERKVEIAQMDVDYWNAKLMSAQKAQFATGNLPVVSSIASAINSAFPDQAYMNAAQVDREYNEAMYRESVSLARDTFRYQMNNIKAQPLIPSKVTTIDCKFLDGVYLEYYSTNSTELGAIDNYYYYNGNRIDDYGTFSDYWGNFVRGKIIISALYTQPEITELNRRLENGIFT